MPGISLIENLQMMLRLANDENRAFTVQRMAQKYGPIYHSSWLPVFKSVTITDANSCKRVLLNSQKFSRMDQSIALRNAVFARFMGLNVANTEGEIWAKQRNIMNPAFVNNSIFTKPFINKCRSCIDRMVQKQNSNGSLISVDIKDVMTRLTLDILGETVFGMEFGYMDGNFNELLEAYQYLFHKTLGNFFVMLFPILTKLPTAHNRKVNQCLDVLDREIYAMINQKRKKLGEIKTQLVKEGEEITEDLIVSHMPSKSLLDFMVLANMRHKLLDESTEQGFDTMSDKELRDNTVILFIAGHETTATALSFALHALGSKPEVQQKIVEEVQQKLTKENEQDYEYEDFMQLEYLNCFIKESLRYYPIVSAVPPRVAQEDDTILGYQIPKGTLVICNTMGLHFSEELWDKPREFKPERFMEEKSIKTASWMPFGLGSHLCVGKNFSLLEQNIFLALLLKDYEVSVKGDLHYEKGFLLTPNQYTLYLKPRK